MSDYLTRHVTRDIPQTEQAHSDQVNNSAGGFSFKVTPQIKLERFLILGSEGGTYYIDEKDLTKQNIDNLRTLTASDPEFVVDLAVNVSKHGRSYKNNAAIFVMAFVMTFGNDAAKSYARTNVNQVVRTSTHLFTFNKYLKALAPGSGLGTSRNRAIAAWYENKSTYDIAYQAVKYRQREGWTHRDSFRQSRPNLGTDAETVALGKWILGKEVTDADKALLPSIVDGFMEAQALGDSKNVKSVLEILDRHPNLPWEALPTQFLKDADVWKKLFYNGQLNGQALVRNITRLSRLNAFEDLVFARAYADRLTDEEMIRKTKLHPINFLNAVTVHVEGQVQRQPVAGYYSVGNRKRDWTTSSIIVDALNAGYHLAFANAVPANKRTLLALDVSGSMSSAMALGLDLTAAQVTGAMAATIAKVEPYHRIMGFSSEFRDLGISANMGLTEVMRRVKDQNFGSTDCGLPMTWALKNKFEYDTFIVMTDNETYAGSVHPHVAIERYRQKMGIDAKMIVVSVTGNDFSIANPNDSGMLDVVGADSNLPKLITEFSAGRL